MTPEERAARFLDATELLTESDRFPHELEVLSKAFCACRNDALEEAARIVECYKIEECTCAAVDIGVGEMHEPGCKIPQPQDIAAAIRKAKEMA